MKKHTSLFVLSLFLIFSSSGFASTCFFKADCAQVYGCQSIYQAVKKSGDRYIAYFCDRPSLGLGHCYVEASKTFFSKEDKRSC